MSSIETKFDIPFVASLAKREKQIQQAYRPVIGVHKWFARRPGTLFRALLLAELGGSDSLAEEFFLSHDFSGKVVADPFMGGGTPVLEANRLGCSVIGVDVNPMAFWVVRQELAPLDIELFLETARAVAEAAEEKIGAGYETACLSCGDERAKVKCFIWVKQIECEHCGESVDLFPRYLLAKNQRHTHYVVLCGACGSLEQLTKKPSEGDRPPCTSCGTPLRVTGPAARGRCLCRACGKGVTYPRPALGAPRHRLVALEYHCQACRDRPGRAFKAPDAQDLSRVEEARRFSTKSDLELVPREEIPEGDETTRLRRWGYGRFDELFNERQLFGLSSLAAEIRRVEEREARWALATVFSDFLRYQNMLCRYDAYALKVLDIFSVHGFPVGLLQCEANLLGIIAAKGNRGIGSGGFRHFVEKYRRAKLYCSKPFETKLVGDKRQRIMIEDERIEASWVDQSSVEMLRDTPRGVTLEARSSADIDLPRSSLDAVLTDPPYFANVQYGELMDFCFQWLRLLLGGDVPEMTCPSTRSAGEVTGNITDGRGLETFTERLSGVFTNFAGALRPGAPFVFTFHHNELAAYAPLVVAILDAGLGCTAVFPCPAEMGASIHIAGTKSSTVDTVFVCRSGVASLEPSRDDDFSLAELVAKDLEALGAGGHEPTSGDERCISFGQAVKRTIQRLRREWHREVPINVRSERALDGLRKVWNR